MNFNVFSIVVLLTMLAIYVEGNPTSNKEIDFLTADNFEEQGRTGRQLTSIGVLPFIRNMGMGMGMGGNGLIRCRARRGDILCPSNQMRVCCTGDNNCCMGMQNFCAPDCGALGTSRIPFDGFF